MLSTPPAFVLSQDQTLQNRYFEEPLGSCITSFCFFTSFSRSDSVASLKVTWPAHLSINIQFSRFIPCCSLYQRQLLYITTKFSSCQHFFNFFWNFLVWKMPRSSAAVVSYRRQEDTILSLQQKCKPFFKKSCIYFYSSVFMVWQLLFSVFHYTQQSPAASPLSAGIC